MSDFTITEGAVPDLSRAAVDNPFTAHFPTAEGKSIVIRLDGNKEATSKTVTNITGKIRRAADALNPPMTGRVHVTEETEGTGKTAKTVTVLTAWTAEKITRTRKPKDGETETAQANNEATGDSA
jgi:hypothetical protein